MELNTDNKTVVCLALVCLYAYFFISKCFAINFSSLALKAVALSSGPDRPHQPSVSSHKDYSLDFMRHCVRERMETGVGFAGKSAISIYILFSQHGTTKDAEEFVSAVINEKFVIHNLKYLQDSIESCMTKATLDLLSARAFDTVCRQFIRVWSLLVTKSGINKECVCRMFLSALIQSLQVMCKTVSDNFSILHHYILYERLGTLSKILGTCVNQIYFTTADAQKTAEKLNSKHEKYSGEWVIRAIGTS